MKTKYSIIYCDNNPDDHYLFQDALHLIQGFDCTLSIANTGEQLLQLLNRPDTTPDIVFLDINLDDNTGLNYLAHLRTLPQFGMLPIIMFSTCHNPETIAQAFQQKANGFAVKPYGFKNLISTIELCLMHISQSHVPEEQFCIRL